MSELESLSLKQLVTMPMAKSIDNKQAVMTIMMDITQDQFRPRLVIPKIASPGS